MQALRSPFSSRAVTPRIVLPAGLHTLSFNTAGCSPVCNCNFAEPKTVWLTSLYAVERGIPYLTAASAYASIKRSTKAGPQPLIAPPIPIKLSGNSSTVPRFSKSCQICARSSGLSEFVFSKRNTPSPTMAGVFGMTNWMRGFSV